MFKTLSTWTWKGADQRLGLDRRDLIILQLTQKNETYRDWRREVFFLNVSSKMLMRLFKERYSFLYVWLWIKFKKQNLELMTKVQVEVSHTTLLYFPSVLLCSAIHFFPYQEVFFWSCNYPFFALPTWVYHFLLTCMRWHQTSQLCCPCENYEILCLCGLNCEHGFSAVLLQSQVCCRTVALCYT